MSKNEEKVIEVFDHIISKYLTCRYTITDRMLNDWIECGKKEWKECNGCSLDGEENLCMNETLCCRLRQLQKEKRKHSDNEGTKEKTICSD